ncbi:AMP-binding & Acyl-protein synthetase [Moelleriella libera RCEF 2490]|uniref:AMP-binding & Acyl-protein synthetase n=1 Tax=Moelleriella libera RCEF 2490 TaxID=1081109 RepID=A0A162IS42_9HYPO|nr:AMP-binding & Acyl-protein synthetase [Moelleriella libera RCEF 2490]
MLLDPRQANATSSGRASCLQDALRNAAIMIPPPGMKLYPPGNVSCPTDIKYRSLYAYAQHISRTIKKMDGFFTRQPVLLYLDDHWDTILFFWAVLLADGIPVLLSPLSNIEKHRQAHLESLSDLLQSPLCFTTETSVYLFSNERHHFQLRTVESLMGNKRYPSGETPSDEWCLHPNGTYAGGEDLAMLMLTSGSTGNAKAVELSHNQVLTSLAAKWDLRRPPASKPFLNWIKLDHVAGLAEIHLQAILWGVDQVHVHPADVVSDPTKFLELLSLHQVSCTFAPNFFLAKLVAGANVDVNNVVNGGKWDLSSLRLLISGGESNDMRTCVAASSLLSQHGAPGDVIVPGFGMTETCAGAIYNINCPAYDLARNNVLASLGKGIKGIEFRIGDSANGDALCPDQVGSSGELQVRGDVVFKRYYRNTEATNQAFTPDGWFRTGDQATIDGEGMLNISGRVKDVINLNGIKFNCTELQTLLEQMLGAQVNRVIVFPSRMAHEHSEKVTVAYAPREWPVQAKDAVHIHDQILDVSIVATGHPPFVFFVANVSELPQSTLGKMSRTKMRSLFEEGMFAGSIAEHDMLLQAYRARTFNPPSNESEACLINDFAEILGVHAESISADISIFNLGFASMDLIRLKRAIDRRLRIQIPVIELMRNPTAKSLAHFAGKIGTAVCSASCDQKASAVNPPVYDPVVPLRTEGSKAPLWLVHPGVEEILVFVGLAQHLEEDDRPVYALRARGFDKGQIPFDSIGEAVSTYHQAIRRRQPQGPYALAGYSYGSMLAFEVAKLLEQEDGVAVQFLGLFNLPPHIKTRMRQLNRNMCLLHLVYFIGLITDEYFVNVEDSFRSQPSDEALAQLLAVADKKRMMELGLDAEAVSSWAELAHRLQQMAQDYEPQGMVSAIDVFHAQPLKAVASSRSDWVDTHLSKWKRFCSSNPYFHAVDGAHYTMIGPDHVVGFSNTLREALRVRGL